MTNPSILILPGDGIGPEVMKEVRKVIGWYGKNLGLGFDVSEDLVGGIADIQSNTIRTVGRAQERFEEDPLRKLRALRFAGRTGSKLEKNTAEAIISDNSLEDISPERIRDEFKKSVTTAKSPKKYLEMVEYFKMWPVMFPTVYVDKRFIDTRDWIIQIATLFGVNENDQIKSQLNRLTFSSKEIDSIRKILGRESRL